MKKEICCEGYRYLHRTTRDRLTFTRHTHKIYEIMYFFRGETAYSIENQLFHLSPGDILLIPPAHQHCTIYEGDAPYERAVINFSDSLVDHALVKRVFADTRVFHTSSVPAFLEYYKRLDSYADLPHREDRGRVGVALLTELLCLLASLDPSLAVLAVGKRDAFTETVLSYIEQNLTSITSMEDICHALYVSPSHLCKIFRETLNISPMKYLRQRRLHRAHDLLRSGERPTNLYLECGFRNYSSFYRAYREYFGTSPAEQ